jgi:hypothetical protein
VYGVVSICFHLAKEPEAAGEPPRRENREDREVRPNVPAQDRPEEEQGADRPGFSPLRLGPNEYVVEVAQARHAPAKPISRDLGATSADLRGSGVQSGARARGGQGRRRLATRGAAKRGAAKLHEVT